MPTLCLKTVFFQNQIRPQISANFKTPHFEFLFWLFSSSAFHILLMEMLLFPMNDAIIDRFRLERQME